MKADPTGKPCFAVFTLGCKVNQYESEALALDLKNRGWVRAEPGREADLFIINTCTVTGKAAMQVRQLIRKTIRMNPEACIVVTGCYAQTEPEEIQKITGVHYVIGQAGKDTLADLLDAETRNRTLGTRKDPLVRVRDIKKTGKMLSRDFPVAESRTRPAVKVQDGCNAFCTYCIVPYARGRSRSLPVSEVIDQVNRIHPMGFKEIVITGIHLGLFGKDLAPRTDLQSLLEQVLDSTSIPRIRLSSIEPDEVSEPMIALVKNNPRLCRHFHLPLQSGDNTILKRMGRPYTREDFETLVRKIHGQIPDAGIGADVLVGFPGETLDHFQNTLDLIEALPLTYLHVFPYSPRKGTLAAGFADRVSPGEIKQRCERLRALGNLKKESFYQSLVGKKVSVLMEEKSPGTKGLLKGWSSQYVPVLTEGGDHLKNTLVSVTLGEVVKGLGKEPRIFCMGTL